ncbi:MAG: FG-GAP-like repeat-containing protein [Promethearchaeota archaeon]
MRKSVGGEPQNVFVADANNDGYNDMVTANLGTNDLSILLWNSTSGDWDSEMRKSVGGEPQNVFVADANNDGYNDMVTTNLGTNDLSILLWNSTSGSWDSEIRKSAGDFCAYVCVGDVNNDGYNDIVTANPDSVWPTLIRGKVSILLWNSVLGDWDSEIQKIVGVLPRSVFIGDANNDGYNDIVTANAMPRAGIWADVSILLWNSASGDWDSQIREVRGLFPSSVFIEDANNDGYNDIVTANPGSNDVSILLWNSTLGDWESEIRKSVGSGPQNVFVADANNDGYNDIVTANYGNYVSILLWNSPPFIIINEPPQYEIIGDIAPEFDITVRDYDLDSMWYTLDNGITNITFSQFIGSIDQLEWNELEDGTVIIEFFANDTAGQIGNAFLIVGKNVWSQPNPPINVNYYSGYYSIYLVWDPPEYSAPVNNYNVYRGDISGGEKIYVGSTDTNNFTDDTVGINKDYYYIIRAENLQGESNASEEIYAIAGPYIRWQTPDEEKRIILPVGDAVFDFSYNYSFLDDIKLFLNEIDYGSVKDKSSTILDPYNASIDGPVNAVLYGYELGNPNPIVSDSRNFIFGKLDLDVEELLERGDEYLGQKLYLILHDPNGDNSYTLYEETAIASMAVGVNFKIGSSHEIALGDIVSLELGMCGIDVGGTFTLKLAETTEEGFDYRLEITDTTKLTSSQDDSNSDYIGPGYGDRYWGEAWTLQWETRATHRIYFNGTERYEEPQFNYGVIRGGEVFLNDYDAPAHWRILNPIHNGWQNVTWMDNLTVSGGSPYTGTSEITTTSTTTTSVEIALGSETYAKIPGFGYKLTLDMSTKWYAETSVTQTYKVGYVVNDDESTDKFVQQYGIDQTFGTFIFQTNEFMCETSYPLEHNTFDYLPPIIQFPDIELDSSQDGLAPCEDDSPIVTVDLFDEGGIQSALIFFSIDDGVNWHSAVLSEQIANPETWQGTIPAHDHGTTVLWYIKVWDLEGSYSNRTDPNGNPFSYTVINRPPTVSILNPSGGEIYQDIVNIEWVGFDPENDALTYSLAYNLDNTGWHLIVSDITDTSYSWDVSEIASDNVLLKIIVSDGDIQTEDVMAFVFSIIQPPHAPDIISPSDIQYLVGSSGNIITWKISDDDLDLYKVYKDGMFLFSTDIEGTPSTTDEEFEVTLNIDGLELGTYVYKIEIFDDSGFIVTDEVIVNVYNNPTITSSVFDSIISWNITDTHFETCEYIIYRNGIEIKTGSWEPGIPVEISYAGLAKGTYEFLIYATDGLGGLAADFVLITVEGTLTNFLLIGIIIGGAIAGIAFLILILRYRLKRRKLTS